MFLLCSSIDSLLEKNFLTCKFIRVKLNLSEPVPVRKVENPFAVERPKATTNMLVRQGSFRGFENLQKDSSPFKRSVSLRLSDLPSTLQRQGAITESSPPKPTGN